MLAPRWSCLVVLVLSASYAQADRVPRTLRMRVGQAPTDTPPAAPDDEELARLAQADAEAQELAGEELITVTGSTLDRRELTTPAPLTVVDRADLDAAGLTSVGDILQRLPSQSNALNAKANYSGEGSTRINLRGLGTSRTLVLLDGRRVVAGGLGADAAVDLSALPLAVIERVEVLEDGASAIYGSDAIGGVVNVITREDFDGTEVALYSGGTPRGDGFNYDVSFASGHTWKKGSVLVAAGWQRQRPVFARDRAFSAYDREYDFTNPDRGARESIGGSSAPLSGRLAPSTIDVDGDGITEGIPDLCGGAAACKADGAGGWVPFVEPDDLYNYQQSTYLYTPSQRYNVYTKGHHELGRGVKAFFDGLYVNRRSEQLFAPEPFFGEVPVSGQSIFNTTGGDIYDYRRRLEEFGARSAQQDVDTFRLVAGLSGKIGDSIPALENWKWEASYNFGHTSATQRNEGSLILSRLGNAIGPSFIDVDGVARCGTPTNVIVGCVPLDILGPAGSIDATQRGYVTFTGISTGYNDQKTALAHARGRLVKLPNGGDISLAVGGDYRIESGGFTPDPLTATGDTTGDIEAPTAGSYRLIEGFSEVSIVPVSGREYAEWTELDLALRGVHYDSFGSALTWKAGALVKTIGGVAVRGTYGTAFRAPTVRELYQGRADSFPEAIDPCDTDIDGDGVSDGPLSDPVAADRCTGQGVPADAVLGTRQQPTIIGGNPALTAETATVLTAGFVVEPPPVAGLSVTVDYFRVRIADAIQALGAQVHLASCYTRNQDDACARITRDPQRGYVITAIEDTVSNVGGTATSGIDVAIAYQHSHGGNKFRHQLEGEYLLEYAVDDSTQTLQGAGYYDLGAYPRIKANLSSAWTLDRVSAGVNARFIGGFKECLNNDCNTPENLTRYSRDVAANFTGDVFVGYTMKSKAGTTQLTVGVNNVTDQRPPLIYIGFESDSDAATYDYMGRYVYARMAQRF